MSEATRLGGMIIYELTNVYSYLSCIQLYCNGMPWILTVCFPCMTSHALQLVGYAGVLGFRGWDDFHLSNS